MLYRHIASLPRSIQRQRAAENLGGKFIRGSTPAAPNSAVWRADMAAHAPETWCADSLNSLPVVEQLARYGSAANSNDIDAVRRIEGGLMAHELF